MKFTKKKKQTKSYYLLRTSQRAIVRDCTNFAMPLWDNFASFNRFYTQSQVLSSCKCDSERESNS